MSQYRIEKRDGRLSLVDCWSDFSPLAVDFGSAAMRYRLEHLSAKNEMLIKAAGATRSFTVFDMTAGLAKDAFVLAAFGCEVYLKERSSVLFLLIQDGLSRARLDPELRAIANRMHLVLGDSCQGCEGVRQFDVAMIDPMFPVKKKSALASGEMQILQSYLGENRSPEKLLVTAFDMGIPRIAVKRSLRDTSAYSKRSPVYALKGRSSRFDIFVQQRV
jgi:16S rRNA (guanine1516-N2)-methyltransferase